MSETARADRRDAVVGVKRAIILEAALRVFATAGLRGASMRAIAKEAGYVPGAIYAYFPSKEHIYAAALGESLTRLRRATEDSAAAVGDARSRFVAAGLAFFDFYDANPRDLDLGFYLLGGGIAPRGLSDDLNRELNAALLATLEPVRGAARELGAGEDRATVLTADVFAHASGLLLLSHTRRLALFRLDARELMRRHLDQLASSVAEGRADPHLRSAAQSAVAGRAAARSARRCCAGDSARWFRVVVLLCVNCPAGRRSGARRRRLADRWDVVARVFPPLVLLLAVVLRCDPCGPSAVGRSGRPHPARPYPCGPSPSCLFRNLMNLAGLPATTAYGSTSLSTTDPPPTTACAPIFTGPATSTLVASQAPSPISMS
jgi:AcrR family transcriptional regulator